MEPMATIALRAARKAADVMVRAHDRLDELAIEEKSKNDYVSNIDKECEEIIIDALHTAYPEHGIIGEESGQAYQHDEFNWIIDPLDGTSNFLHGIPHFSISIALKKGRHIEHGVVVNPLQNEEFVASRGKGAQLNGKRIRVANQPRLDGTFIASGLPPALLQTRLEPYLAMFGDCMGACGGMRRSGSAALDLAYVAAGRLDAFWEPGLKAWDMAAGIVLVREAGGFVGDFRGGDTMLEDGHIIAANPKLFKALVQLLKPNVGALLA